MAYSKISALQIQSVQRELLALSNTDNGKEVLKRIGVNAFDAGSEAKLRDLPQWLNQEAKLQK